MAATPDPRVFALVPARSGSTRIPDKNLQRVGDRTLLERAVHVAAAAFGRCWVSTDSERYAAVARAAGAEVPSLRPADLSGADAPVDGAITHALGWAPAEAEVLVLVQPTSPFTEPGDLRAVVEALDATGAACALTAHEVPATTAFLLEQQADGTSRFVASGALGRRTQDLGVLSVPTGAAYAASIARLAAGEALVREPVAVVLVDGARTLDIDEPADLARAQALAR